MRTIALLSFCLALLPIGTDCRTFCIIGINCSCLMSVACTRACAWVCVFRVGMQEADPPTSPAAASLVSVSNPY